MRGHYLPPAVRAQTLVSAFLRSVVFYVMLDPGPRQMMHPICANVH